MKKITKDITEGFGLYLAEQEKSEFTQKKYLRDVSAFVAWLDGRIPDKKKVIEYKGQLMSAYAPSSVNSVLSSLNSFFDYLGWHNLKVRMLKIQKRVFADKEKELTREEYKKLLLAAETRGNKRLYYLMQTICSTGIRISELKFVTVEAINKGKTNIHSKGKLRTVILPEKLCAVLRRYAKKHRIVTGAVFISKNGNPLDRSNIWSEMKKLCAIAGVSENKVFPHNLRHLFARTFYTIQKDISRLADILGHTSINTTRIYTMESGDIHRRQIQELGLLLC